MNLGDMESFDPVPERPERKPDLPAGWEPHFRYDGDKNEGELVTPDQPPGVEPDQALWDRIFRDFGLSPSDWEIIEESISLIGWEAPLKGAKATDKIKTINLTRYKVRLRKRLEAINRVDVEEVMKVVRRRRAKPPELKASVGERMFVAPLADWQIGKGEGDGSLGTVERIKSKIELCMTRLDELAKLGRGVEVVYLVGMGDMVEQCSGHYPGQEFTTDLNRREQKRVVTNLIFEFVDRLVMAGYRVVMAAVPGNHGENRKNGKAFTTIDDNDDLDVFENVATALKANPDRYEGRVTCVLPTNTYSFTLDIGGVPVGFFHGHVTKGGSSPIQKIRNWWRDQIMGNRDTVKDAQILVTAHYHHFVISETSGRTHMQCPTLDPGSQWWTEMTGENSPQGMLTFCAGTDCGPRGWDELAIL